MGGPNDITRGKDGNYYIAEQELDGKPAQVCVRDPNGTVLVRFDSRHDHGVGVNSRGDIYAGLTTERSVDKFRSVEKLICPAKRDRRPVSSNFPDRQRAGHGKSVERDFLARSVEHGAAQLPAVAGVARVAGRARVDDQDRRRSAAPPDGGACGRSRTKSASASANRFRQRVVWVRCNFPRGSQGVECTASSLLAAGLQFQAVRAARRASRSSDRSIHSGCPRADALRPREKPPRGCAEDGVRAALR